MGKYIIKASVAPGGGYSEEFNPDSQLVNGIEADGFIIMTMKGDRPGATIIHSLTTLDLARLFTDEETEGGSTIHQALAIAEGLNKAAEIKKKYDRDRTARSLVEMLRER